MGHEGLPQSIETTEVNDTAELLNTTKDAIDVAKKGKQKEPYLFMVAAVSDFTPKFPKEGKLKKSMLSESWNIELKQTPDILSTLDKTNIKTIAFKAEMDTQNGLKNAQALIENKRVDAVCYNLLQNSESFGTSDNEITFITKESQIPLGKSDKLTLSHKILAQAKALNHE